MMNSAQCDKERAIALLQELDGVLDKSPPKVTTEEETESSEIDGDYINSIHESDKTQNRQEILPHVLFSVLSKRLGDRLNANNGPPLRLCSVGCGDGLLDYRFLRKFLGTVPNVSIDYTGLDLNEYFCGEARSKLSGIEDERLKSRVLQKDFERADVDDAFLKKFDVVYSIHVMYYITDLPLVVDKILSMVKPGGLAVIGGLTDHGLTGLRRVLRKHEGGHHFWTINNVMEMFDEKGIPFERETLAPIQDIQHQVKDNFSSQSSKAVLDFACHTKMKWYCEEAVRLSVEYLKVVGDIRGDAYIIDHPTELISALV